MSADKTATPTIRGYLEGVIRGHAVGWCWHPERPGERVEVEVVIDATVVASGRADLPREGLARAGYGDGRHGFRVPLPAALADGGEHRIHVRAGAVILPPFSTFADGSHAGETAGKWLTTSFAPDAAPPAPHAPPQPAPAQAQLRSDAPPAPPARAQATPASPRPSPARTAGRLAGYVDGVTGGRVVGWVADPDQPDVSLSVEALLDGVLVGEAVADGVRADVAARGMGERHGFRIELPGPLEAGEHVLEVRTAPDGRRVPLVRDYVLLDDRQRPVEGVVLVEPRTGWLGGVVDPGRALLGRDGWLFEWPGRRPFDVLRGAQSMPRAVLERRLERLVERSQTVRAAGATPVSAVVATKLAVYREQLPQDLTVHDDARPADELAAAARDVNDAELLDLTVALRQARRHGAIFARTGSGLTWLGGFHAYRCVAKELAKRWPALEPLQQPPLSGLEPVPGKLAELPRLVWTGSDAVAAGVADDQQEREGRPSLEWARLPVRFAVVGAELAAFARSPTLLRNREPAPLGHALVVHDGSATEVVPFLASHFEQTLTVAPDDELPALLERFAPAAVIEIVGEPSLLR